jgi:hypothetical protein
VVGPRIRGSYSERNTPVELNASRERQRILQSTNATVAAKRHGLQRRIARARRRTSTVALLELRSPQNYLSQRERAPRAVSPAPTPLEKHLADSSPEELRKLVQRLKRTPWRNAVTLVPVVQDASGTVVQAPAYFAIGWPTLPKGAETSASALFKSAQARIPEQNAKPSRVCFEPAAATEPNLGPGLPVGDAHVSATNEASAGPLLPAFAGTSDSARWRHSDQCAADLLRDDERHGRERQVQWQHSLPPARVWGPTRGAGSSEVAPQPIYGKGLMRLCSQLSSYQLEHVLAPRSKRGRRIRDNRSLPDVVGSRWYWPTQSALAETIWPTVRADLAAHVAPHGPQGRLSVCAGIPRSSERAGRPLRSRSIPPTLGGALYEDSTRYSVAQAP